MISFRLILQSGLESGKEYPLEKTEVFLGRDLTNDVVINDPEVSRRHAHLTLKGNTFSIEDLGSTNGTFLRGQRISAPVLLNPGEEITLGEHVQLLFDVVVMDVNATVAAFREPEVDKIPAAPAFPHPYVPEAPQATVPPPAPFDSDYPEFRLPVEQKPPAAAAPAYHPVAPPVQPAAAPRRAAPLSASPLEVEPEIPQEKKRSPWLVALLIVIGILLIFCVIPWLIIEFTDSYCTLFPGLFNSIQAGACP